MKKESRQSELQYESRMNPARGSFRFAVPLAALGLILITLIVYAPSFKNGFIWDDDAYVTSNTLLRTADGLWAIWAQPMRSPQYYPVTFTTFWIEHHLWGDQPAGYHVVNVLLHALNAVLIWRILRKLGVCGAWWVAAIFAVHPVHVESVAWVTERKNVLSGLFYLGAFWVCWKFLSGEDRRQRRRLYIFALALFVGALLSKSVTATLPAALLLVIWWKRGRVGWGDVKSLVPFFVIGIASGLWTAWIERHHVHASGADWDLSIALRIGVAGRAIWFYASQLIWPAKVMFVYPRWEVEGVRAWMGTFPVLVVLFLVAAWLLRKRLGRGLLVATLFFIGTLLPALGLVNVFPMRFSFVADHFEYLASVGVTALLVVFIRTTAKRRWTPVVCAVILIVLASRTWSQQGDYANAATLWQRTLDKNSDAWIAQANLGVIELSQGRLEEAERLFQAVETARPHDVEPLINLALVASARSDADSAIEMLDRATSRDPKSPEPWFQRGGILDRRGEIDGAIASYRKTIELAPEHVPARVNLGVLLNKQSHPDEAAEQFQKALELDPDSIFALVNMGDLHLQAAHFEQAVELYERALALDPNLPGVRQNLDAAMAEKRRSGR